MVEVEIRVPPGVDWAHAELAVESVCAAEGLAIALKATLVRFPGSIHWHVTRPRQLGTLEVTLWESRRRIWLSTRSGRTAPWTDAVAPRLQESLEAKLRAGPESPPRGDT